MADEMRVSWKVKVIDDVSYFDKLYWPFIFWNREIETDHHLGCVTFCHSTLTINISTDDFFYSQQAISVTSTQDMNHDYIQTLSKLVQHHQALMKNFFYLKKIIIICWPPPEARILSQCPSTPFTPQHGHWTGLLLYISLYMFLVIVFSY